MSQRVAGFSRCSDWRRVSTLIPFHEKSDTDVNPESIAVSKFFNCELRIANCELVLTPVQTRRRSASASRKSISAYLKVALE
jgi:hypothetical protein